MLSAGKRDRRITVELGASTQDPDSGEPSWTYATYFECWAERRALTGVENFKAQQIAAKVDAIYSIPYPHGKVVSPHERWRVIDQGVTYDVSDVAEVGVRGRVGLNLMASARADEAV